jgi:23S rRNA (guanosine2251-2'-O)-methyltransferase
MKTIKKEPNIIVILPDIRSAENVGSIFRTSEALGVDQIVLGGITPDPTDRFNRPNSKIAKTALGAEKTISWTHCNSLSARFSRLKKSGYTLVGIEQDKRSVDYKKIKNTDKMVFVMGNEVEGLPKNILDKMDIIAEIPMRGGLVRNRPLGDTGKESLNVSVSFGVALFRILKK